MSIIVCVICGFGILFGLALLFVGSNMFAESIFEKFVKIWERVYYFFLSGICIMSGICSIWICGKIIIDKLF